MAREVLPLTIHELPGGSGQGNVAGPNGWPFEVRTPNGPVYRAGSRKACERWAKRRDEWVRRDYPFDYKSRYLDLVEGELIFEGEGAPYGIIYRH